MDLGPGGGPLDITYTAYADSFATWAREGLTQVGLPQLNSLTSGDLMGSGWPLSTIDRTTGFRESFETAFLQPALGRANLHVYTDTMAKRVLFDGNAATGVVVESSGQFYTLKAAREVIVSAGAIQSP